MRQTMPEDRIIMRDREGDEARLSKLLKTDQALKRQTVTAVRTLMWRKRTWRGGSRRPCRHRPGGCHELPIESLALAILVGPILLWLGALALAAILANPVQFPR